MSDSAVACPGCGTALEWRRAPVEYACPHCGSLLRLPHRYKQASFWTAAFAVPFVGYALGLSRDEIWLAEFVVLNVFHLLALVPVRVFPPLVEMKERRQMLHGGLPLDVLQPVRVETVDQSVEDPLRRRRMFQLTNPPVSLEGIAIVVVGIALALSQVVVHGEALIAKVYPEFRATKTGPKGFPITVHIGADALHVTNGSDRAWYCYFRLGRPTSERATLTSPVRVEPGGGVDVAYRDFLSVDPRVDAAVRRRLARDDMQAQCAEPSGLSHYGTLR